VNLINIIRKKAQKLTKILITLSKITNIRFKLIDSENFFIENRIIIVQRGIFKNLQKNFICERSFIFLNLLFNRLIIRPLV
jgi:hypothetical protein